jgi:hypothetical protein
MSEVELSNDTVVETAVDNTPEPFIEAAPEKEVEKEVPVEAKSSKDMLDEIVAKVKGQAKEKEEPQTKASQVATKTASPEVSQPEYTPNFKFTANKKEQEIPEFLRDVIKDKASEKQVRELCEKAYGLDTVKAEREAINKNFTEVASQHQNLLGGIQALRNDYQKGDLDSFFQKLKIPEEVVLQYALKKAQEYNLPPEQRAQLDAQRRVEQQARLLETQNSTLEASNAQAATRMKQLELDFTFMKPEITALEKSIEERTGKAGVLRQMVIDHGYNTWVQSKGKIDLTPAQALAQVIERYGLKGVESVTASAPKTENVSTAPGTQAPVQRKVTTIPNMKGSSTASPIRSKPKNLDDLRKIASQM